MRTICYQASITSSTFTALISSTYSVGYSPSYHRQGKIVIRENQEEEEEEEEEERVEEG
jgi:hypothetical protein